jgi:DNA polymerase-4
MAGRVGVKIRCHDFATFTRQRSIAPPTQDGRAVRDVARELLRRWLAEHRGAKLRLLGVVLGELAPAGQLGLFETTAAGGSSERLDSALDQVRERFGSRALRRGNMLD